MEKQEKYVDTFLAAPMWLDSTDMQDDLNIHILHMLKDTFSLHAAHTYNCSSLVWLNRHRHQTNMSRPLPALIIEVKPDKFHNY